MRKTFSFTDTAHKSPQAIARVKHTVRKYLKRERRKSLPEGIDFWDFDCKVGADEAGAATVNVRDVIPGIDAVAQAGAEAVYIEILAKPGVRVHQPRPEHHAEE
ncbi:MAG: DUF6172 family protein [Myxococcota bacterium]|nr:DUF6172 family protein [Myxococcota bacterium]